MSEYSPRARRPMLASTRLEGSAQRALKPIERLRLTLVERWLLASDRFDELPKVARTDYAVAAALELDDRRDRAFVVLAESSFDGSERM